MLHKSINNEFVVLPPWVLDPCLRKALVLGLAAMLAISSFVVSADAEAAHVEYGQPVEALDSSSGSEDERFSIALNNDGYVYTSGSNNRGQMGTGDNESSAGPRRVLSTGVLADKTVVAVAAGALHALALDSGGGVYSWGENESGQLGDGTYTDRNAPVAVDLTALPAGRKIVKIAAGAGHSAAIDDVGVVYSWGNNDSGELGDGTTINKATPVSLSSSGALSGLAVSEISLGGSEGWRGFEGFSVAVLDTGVLVAWGRNDNGQLGDGTQANRSAPVLVDSSGVLTGKSLTQLSSGGRFTVAIDSSGEVYSWGANNFGQLGDGTTTRRLSAVSLDASGALSGKKVVSVSAGDQFAVAMDETGSVYGWGLNSSGQLGVSSTTVSYTPLAVDTSSTLSGKNLTTIAAGHSTSLVLDDAGVIFGWGSDQFGQLAVGLTVKIRSPILITSGGSLTAKTIRKTAFGYEHTLFIASDGLIYAAGQNGYRQLGNGATAAASAPLATGPSGGVLEGKTFTAVAAGIYHSLALDSAGKVYSWGYNGQGQLGIGSTVSSDPTLVAGILATKTIVAIAAGGYHSIALDSDGVLYSWGWNVNGQLGIGGYVNSTTPTVVDASGVLLNKTISSIYAGDRHSMVLDNAGVAYAWGYNLNGVLGDNSQATRPLPVAVYTAGDLTGKAIVKLSTGLSHTLALDSIGNIYAWGYNGNGEIGDGSGSTRQISPKLISTGDITGKSISSVAVGNGYSLVLDDIGTAYSWGGNSSGQLGVGDLSSRSTPSAVDATGVLSGKTLSSLSTGFAGSASFATDNAGILYGWGRNSNSDLSIGDTGKYLIAKATLFSGHISMAQPQPPSPRLRLLSPMWAHQALASARALLQTEPVLQSVTT